ncbi:hypothetical protein DPEC_G00187180 [Dallia pectoralis]|uniref:Uncharacterized protein n=1 Tax=Dallia pectoralis TaxID=75939 RepID=A0ACC2GBL7_DALPE|nr:hypothetical protein DPEC_G00187180 [Dallia pectoralis]
MRFSDLLCSSLLLILELTSFSVGVLNVVPGSKLVLPCLPGQNKKSFTRATITWDYKKLQFPENQVSHRLPQDGFDLEISSVSIADEGEYQCVIKHNGIEYQKAHTLEVNVTSSYSMKVIEGFNVNLPCEHATSKDTKWYKEVNANKMQLNPVETRLTEEASRLEWLYGPFEDDLTITITEVTMEDAGIYLCETPGKEKSSSIILNKIELIVEAKPTVRPFSCAPEFTTPWEPCQDEINRSWEAMLKESLNEFSMELFDHLRKSKPSKNLLYSPISITGLLTHLLLGARGETKSKLQAALCLTPDFLCVHNEMKKLKQKLSDTLKISSQIYYNHNMKLSESFTNQSVQFYDANPVQLTNSSETNTEMINSWVAKQTNNKITHLVDSVPSHTEMVLLNAVYFNGQWKTKFNPQTKPSSFVKLTGDTVSVPVLYSTKYQLSMQYVPSLMAQVAMFPLSGDSSLFILLPPTHKLTDLELVEGKMKDSTITQMVAEMKKLPTQMVEVSLPKIKLDVQTEMNSLLQYIGLTELFEDPNLCGLAYEQKLVVTDARHRAFLSLTEQGVEAGATSSISFSRSYSIFSALRPFLLIVWSDRAGAPLFVGRVTEP